MWVDDKPIDDGYISSIGIFNWFQLAFQMYELHALTLYIKHHVIFQTSGTNTTK